MTLSRNNGQSRPGSSPATSIARETLKRRDRPYRTEQEKVWVRKRKLDVHTSYKKAPAGYTFLPVGTPDLADLCKELSRQRGCPVNVVNAKPMSKHAIDPQKVSHHIHRIGYHFKSEIVDDASQELGYVYYRGKFIKEDVMQAQRSKGRLKNIMAKYGISMQDNDTRETPEQVSAYIKELFPRIPQEDLDKIVQHAWEEGSKRVGTNENMNLANRVQLAVTARIRHAYTDYDRLLKAFEWKDARHEVEAECVKKLKEWRGEDGNDDDDKGFEETMRDVIVLDDDDDENIATNDNDESEEDDVSVGDADYASDPSIEIVEHRMTDNDFAAESSLRSPRPMSSSRLREWIDRDQRRHSPKRIEHPRLAIAEPYRTSLQPQPAASPTYRAYPMSHPTPQSHSVYQQPPQYTPLPSSKPVLVPVPHQEYRTGNAHMPTAGYVYHPQPQPWETPQQPPQYQHYQPNNTGEQQRGPITYVPDPHRMSVQAAPHDRPLPSIERAEEPPQPPPGHTIYAYPREMQSVIQDYGRRPAEVVDLTTPPPGQRYYYPVHGAPHPAQYVPR